MHIVDHPLRRSSGLRARRPKPSRRASILLGIFALGVAGSASFIRALTPSGRDAGLSLSDSGPASPSPPEEVTQASAAPSAGAWSPSLSWTLRWSDAEPVPEPSPAAAEAAAPDTVLASGPQPASTGARLSEASGADTVGSIAAVAEPVAAPQPVAKTVFRVRPAPITMRGKWAPEAAACTKGNRRTPYVPLLITDQGATAGSGTCRFLNTRQDGNQWSITAACTDGASRWTSHVKLLRSGSRLTWTSERGSQSYTRCL